MTDGERKLNESDAALLSVVIDDNEIRGSGWAKSLAGGFKLVGRVVAPPPLPPPLASGVFSGRECQAWRSAFLCWSMAGSMWM